MKEIKTEIIFQIKYAVMIPEIRCEISISIEQLGKN